MAIAFKTPDEVADEYLTHLKATKPTADTKQKDNDWTIRAKTTGGVVAGAYSDQRKVGDDAFPQSARREAVLRHLKMYKNEDAFRSATQSTGFLAISGNVGGEVAAGAELSYPPNGNTYEVLEAVTLDGPTGMIEVVSIGVGQIQNLEPGAELVFTSPPVDVDSTATVLDPGLLDGKNEETEEEAAQRVLDFIQTPPKGGHSSDYEQWAKDADPAVSFSRCIRFVRGGGTIGVVITSGTTDIDTALDNGQPILFEPSDALIDVVTTFIEGKRPETDCISVYGADEDAIGVSCRAKFVSGTKDTELPDFIDPLTNLPMTQGELLAREIKRAIYKTPIGGTKIGTTGYIMKKTIQDMIDSQLGAELTEMQVTGTLAQILLDRVITITGADDVGGVNKSVQPNAKPIPGTITITDW